jgi:hypothetical protein
VGSASGPTIQRESRTWMVTGLHSEGRNRERPRDKAGDQLVIEARFRVILPNLRTDFRLRQERETLESHSQALLKWPAWPVWKEGRRCHTQIHTLCVVQGRTG